jgi:hypothetical protein
MLAKITLALALVIVALATMAPAGPRDGGQAASTYDSNMGSGGGNLVPLW